MAATKLRIFQDALRLLAEARLNIITDDVEAQFALSDAWAGAVEFVLREAPWRFALTTATVSGGASVLPGYAYHFTYPADRLRTHSIFVAGNSDRPEYPIDIRERQKGFEAHVSSALIRYVSSTYSDPELVGFPWPEHFAQCVAAYLAFSVAERVTGERGASGRMSELFSSLLPEAKRIDAEPESRWLPYQRNGEMLIGARDLLRRAGWRFALVDAAISTHSGTPAGAFAFSFQQPADWLRTQKLYLAANSRECPINIREQGGYWSADASAFKARYVSAVALRDTTQWPEPFYTALLAWLEAGMPREMPATRGQDQSPPEWQQAVALAIEAAAEPEDEWLPFQLDGSLSYVAHEMRERAYWRFAIRSGVTVSPATYSATVGAGYTRRTALGSDFTRLRSIYVLTANGEQRPVDVRLYNGFWYANAARFYIDYVAADLGLDSTVWPDLYKRAVLAELVARNAPAAQRETTEKLAALALADAVASEADMPDDWLPYQLDGRFADAVPAVMGRGYWWWALAERQYNSESDQVASDPAAGFAYRYVKPADWFKTHALFVPWDGWDCPINIRQTGTDWGTDAANFVARYVSTAALDTTLWPQPVADSVFAFLEWRAAPREAAREKEAEFDRLFAEAAEAWSRPEDEWLRFQLDGSYQQTVKQLLETGRWRFAVKTRVLTNTTDPLPAQDADGAAVAGYAYRFIQPTDLLRTVRMYYARGAAPVIERFDVDFVDEADAFHANYTPVTVRYVSRLGLDSTRWPAHFRNAALALLEYHEARRDPAKVNIAAAKLQLYKDACLEAERLDDARDRPRVIRPGVFVRARFGRGGRYLRGPILVSTAADSGGLTDEFGNLLTSDPDVGDVLTP